MAAAAGGTRSPDIAVAEARGRLLAAAERLLETGIPYTEVSVADIAAQARLARTTFYTHFASKNALLMTLAEHVTGLFEDAASLWYRLPHDATVQDLRLALEELVGAHRDHRFTMAAVVDAAAYDPEVRATYDRVIQTRIHRMEHSFRTQQRAGRIRPDLDVGQVTPWIAWMVERAPFQLLRSRSDELRDLLDGMTTVLWQALYSAGSHTPD